MYWQKNKKFLGFPRKVLLIYGKCLCVFSCTFSFACPKEKDTKKQRAPSAFLRLRRMASSLKDRNSLCSNSLSFLTGVCLSLFYASKMRTGVVSYSCHNACHVGTKLCVTLTDYVLFLSHARKKKILSSYVTRTIPYYNIYLIYIWRTE